MTKAKKVGYMIQKTNEDQILYNQKLRFQTLKQKEERFHKTNKLKFELLINLEIILLNKIQRIKLMLSVLLEVREKRQQRFETQLWIFMIRKSQSLLQT